MSRKSKEPFVPLTFSVIPEELTPEKLREIIKEVREKKSQLREAARFPHEKNYLRFGI